MAEPVPAANWPAGHGVHEELPFSPANVPEGHERQRLAPTLALKEPSGQSVHEASDAPPRSALYVPEGQAVHEFEPMPAVYDPARQG